MTEAFLSYNCVTCETTSILDGYQLSDLDESFSGRGHLQGWIADYLVELAEIANEDSIVLMFRGEESELEDIQGEYQQLRSRGELDTEFTLLPSTDESQQKDFEALSDELVSILDTMKQLPQFRDDQDFIEDMDRLLNRNEFRVAVIATMSSGKSTLINALVGQKLLPARNEATTAMLTYLYDHDDLDHVEVEAYDEGGALLSTDLRANIETLQDLNDKATVKDEEDLGTPQYPQVFRCDVRLDIPFISNLPVGRLVMIDTPGPNNSGDADHKKVTYSLIESAEDIGDQGADVVIYVMNATQLEVEDDQNLLRDVAEKIKAGGIAAHDRFFFVVNKVDSWDEDEDGPLSHLADKARSYLAQFEIPNPFIILTDAYAAFLGRLDESGQKLTKRQATDLVTHTKILNEYLDVNAGCACWSSIRTEVRNKASATEGKDSVVLLSGVPVLEGCIKRYLNKYWYPLKLRRVAKALRDRLLSQAKLDELEHSLLLQSRERAGLAAELRGLKDLLVDESITTNLSNRYRALAKEIRLRKSPALVEFNSLMNKELNRFRSSPTQDPTALKRRLKELQRKFAKLSGRMQAQAESELTETTKEVQQLIEKEYFHRLQSIIDTSSAKSMRRGDVQLILDGLSLDGIASRARYTIKEKYTYTVKVERSIFNPARWFGSKYRDEERQGQRDKTLVKFDSAAQDVLKRFQKAQLGIERAQEQGRKKMLDSLEAWMNQLVAMTQKRIQEVSHDLEKKTSELQDVDSNIKRLKSEKAQYMDLLKRLDEALA